MAVRALDIGFQDGRIVCMGDIQVEPERVEMGDDGKVHQFAQEFVLYVSEPGTVLTADGVVELPPGAYEVTKDGFQRR